MVFSLLKKLFGGSDEETESAAPQQQNVEPVAQQAQGKPRSHRKSNDERSAERPSKRSQGRKRDPNIRREPLTPHQEYHDAPSNLSPEQQQEVLDKLNNFVQFVAKSLVAFPDQISTEIVPKDNQKVILISCAKGDAGKLIGRNGKIISAIRLLVSGNAARSSLRATVDIKD